MFKVRIAVIYEDISYGQALGRAVSMANWDFQVSVNPQPFCAEEYDLILVGDDAGVLPGTRSEAVDALKEKLVILSSEFCHLPAAEEGMWTEDQKSSPALLYKYEKVSVIAKYLRYLYSCSSGRRNPFLLGEKKPVVLGVASGGDGDTESTAIAVARELAALDETVMYLSFEEFPLTVPWFQEDSACRTVEEYLYYLLSGSREHMITQLSLFTCSDVFGVHTFRAAEGRNQLRTLESGELEKFLTAVTSYASCSYLVLDLGSSLFPNFTYLANCCKRLLLIGKSGSPSGIKSKRLFSHLERELVEGLAEKVYWMETLNTGVARDEETKEALEAALNCSGEDETVRGKKVRTESKEEKNRGDWPDWGAAPSSDRWFQYAFIQEVKKFVRETRESQQR